MSKESKVRRGDLCGSQEMRKGGREDCHMGSIVELMMRHGGLDLLGGGGQRGGKRTAEVPAGVWGGVAADFLLQSLE